MKKNAVRIALLVVVLGGLAAIPASTGGPLASSMSSETDVDLGMVLLVNRLELSRVQMETLRAAILGLVEKSRSLDDRRAAFKQEMIAFHGTAEELDARLASFREETKAAQLEVAAQQDSAITTLKSTLTMEQGEILARAFPEIVASFGESPAAREWGRKMGVRATMRGCVAGFAGPRGTVVVRGMVDAEAETERVEQLTERIRTTVERVRERVAERFGATDTELPKLLRSTPNEAATQTEGARVERLVAPPAPVNPESPRRGGGNPRVTEWLERLARVLELKLAATT